MREYESPTASKTFATDVATHGSNATFVSAAISSSSFFSKVISSFLTCSAFIRSTRTPLFSCQEVKV